MSTMDDAIWAVRVALNDSEYVSRLSGDKAKDMEQMEAVIVHVAAEHGLDVDDLLDHLIVAAK